MSGFWGRWRIAGFALVALVVATWPSGPAAADESLDKHLLMQLGLMRGHLRMARDLVEAGDRKQASLHIHHPLKELYDDIEAELLSRGVSNLGVRLKVLEHADEGGTDLLRPMAAVQLTINLSEASVAASPTMMLDAIVGMLEHAATEYATAYPDNKLEELEEYQDSRGFTKKAEEIFGAIKSNLEKKDAAATHDIDVTLQDLLRAWPELNGPAQPVINAAGVKALVARIGERAKAFSG